VLLGGHGVERIIEVDLNDAERKALDQSAKAVEQGVELLESFYQPGK